MRRRLPLLGAGALALAASIGLAAAQADPPSAGEDSRREAASQPHRIKLSPAQRIAILNAVLRNSAKITPPANFQAAVGGPVPSSVELYVLPSDTQSPQARGLKYTMVRNQVVLVDPTTMRVVDIIRQ